MTLDEQIALYAIGALDERERAEFERQLAASPELRARVAEARAAAMAMMLAVEPVAPSPALKQKVMARIPPQPAESPKPKASGRSDWLRYLFGGAALAFASLALVLGVGLLNTQSQLVQQRAYNAQLQAQLQDVNAQLALARERTAQLERELSDAQSRLAQAEQQIAAAQTDAGQARAELAAAQAEVARVQEALAIAESELGVLSQRDVRVAKIPAFKDDFKQGALSVFYAPDAETALITAHNLPPLSPDQTYQVWLIKGDLRLPSEIFNTAPDGTGRLIVKSDEPFSAFDKIGITIEPAGGRPTPNPDGPIFLGPLG
ncbi:MAG: anti-sigma factor [Anaerolineae bacterium]|nr:anti-sigma factor [Candidatus Roseilinea sp.]MDW8449964.1 anti-sigma factor [Anaerolineae bacterium]